MLELLEMKILTYGADAAWCQLPRINKGFESLGHQLTSNPIEADMIYANDFARFGVAIGAHTLNPKAKLILNVLDVPEHNISDFDLDGTAKLLAMAGAVTSISEFTKFQVKKYFNMESTVIYQPIMPIEKNNSEKLYKYIFVGRKYDANKRVAIGVHALWLLGVKGEEVGMVGHEPVDWGVRVGLLDESLMSSIYNGADFSLSLGHIEGLNLPVVEAMAAGIIPVVCNDLTTREELLPSSLFPEYNDVSATASSVSLFIARFMQDNDEKQRMKERIYSHYRNNLEEKFKPTSVAQKIIDTYKKL